MNAVSKEKGFTIIEVVLVLAIAGLIFLMVFIALPALQRNQRDTQRKNDLSRLQTSVTNYSSANRGSLPGTTATITWPNFISTYMETNGDTFVDPSGVRSGQTVTGGGTHYEITSNTTAQLGASQNYEASQNQIFSSPGYTCSATDAATIESGGSRKIAFRIALEGGGFYCVNT